MLLELVCASAPLMNIDNVCSFSHWGFSNVCVLGEKGGREVPFIQGLLCSRECPGPVGVSVPLNSREPFEVGIAVCRRGRRLSCTSSSGGDKVCIRVSLAPKPVLSASCPLNWERSVLHSAPYLRHVFGGSWLSQVCPPAPDRSAQRGPARLSG